MKHTTTGLLALAATFLLWGGCATPPPPPPAKPVAAPEVQAADKLFQAGQYKEAIIACTDIARKDPLTPGLSDLEARIQEKMAVLRKASFERKTDSSDANAIADGRRHGLLPETYGLTHSVRGETAPLRTPPTRMQAMLRKPVSVHLENVSLSDIIAQIGASQNINIITDGSIGTGTLTIHAENTPLNEILDYIGRNLNVSFNVGENVIWITKRANTNDSGIPFETRIYRLRKGLSGDEIQPGSSDSGSSSVFGGSSSGSGHSSSSGRANGNASNGGSGSGAKSVPDVIDTVKRFVSQPTGADILFNTKAHALVVKNTRENLLLTEDLIAALDVRPVQVLIEARFTDVSVSDLRELGIDWLLNKNINIGNNTISKGAGITSLSLGTAGDAVQNPAFLTSGLNLTGVLNDSQFQAVLHAMEQSGKARTLTVPRVTALNNTTAKIRIGEDFRYFDNFTEQQTTVNEVDPKTGNILQNTMSAWVPSGAPELEELGYELLVTPSVGADLSTIDIKLVPQISSVEDKSQWVSYNQIAFNSDGSSTTNTISLPIFDRKVIDTEVNVRSGETVVMGGLATSTRSTTTTGVPILSSLPWIGHLFRTDSTQDNVDNLIIFVTASIVADTGEELIPLNPRELPGLPVAASGK